MELADSELELETKECRHEWVTWTGLARTVTDCSKCKKEKDDIILLDTSNESYTITLPAGHRIKI
jgi:hypothetical protein